MSLRRPRLFGLSVAVLAIALLGAACNSAGADATPGGLPTAIATVVDSRDNDPTNGSGIEPANPDAPPTGEIGDGSTSTALGLGSYCWSPPAASGNPSICADAIGIITTHDELAVSAGAELTVTGDLSWPPMRIEYAMLWAISGAPVDEGDDYRAWHPGEDSVNLVHGEHSVTLPAELEPGEYVLAINYSAGPDRGSEATYGVVLIIE